MWNENVSYSFVIFFKIFSILSRKRRFVFNSEESYDRIFLFFFNAITVYMRYKMKIVPANISKINDQFNSPYPVVI